MIKMGSDVDVVLRETVMQMEHIGEDRLGTISTSSHSVVFFILYGAAYVFSSSVCDSAATQREPSTRKCSLLWSAQEKVLMEHDWHLNDQQGGPLPSNDIYLQFTERMKAFIFLL